MRDNEDTPAANKGQTLIEVLVATVILIIGIWGIMAIFVPGLRTGRANKIRAAGIQLAAAEERRGALMYQYPEAIVAKTYSYDADGDSDYDPVWSFDVLWNVSPAHSQTNTDYLRYVKDVAGEPFVAQNVAGRDDEGEFGAYVVSYTPVLAGSEVVCFARPYPQYERDAVTWPDVSNQLTDQGVDDENLGTDTWKCLVQYGGAETRIYFDDYQHPLAVPETQRWFKIDYSWVDADDVVHDVVGEVYVLGDNDDPTEPPLNASILLGDTPDRFIPRPGAGGAAADVIPGSVTVCRLLEGCRPRTSDLGTGDRSTAAGVIRYYYRPGGFTVNQVARAVPGDLLRVDYSIRGKRQRLAIQPGRVDADNLYFEIPDVLNYETTLPADLTDYAATLPGERPAGGALADDLANGLGMAMIDLSRGHVYTPLTSRALEVDYGSGLVHLANFAALPSPEGPFEGRSVRFLYRTTRGWALQPALSAARYAIRTGDLGDPATWRLAPGVDYQQEDPGIPGSWRWVSRYDYVCPVHPAVVRSQPGVCPMHPPASPVYLAMGETGSSKQFWLQIGDAVTTDGWRYTSLAMPKDRVFYSGATVSVDYVHLDADGDPQPVWGETHVLAALPDDPTTPSGMTGWLGLRLTLRYVVEIRAVRGLSVYQRCLWHDPAVNFVLLPLTGRTLAARVYAKVQLDSSAVREGLVQ